MNIRLQKRIVQTILATAVAGLVILVVLLTHEFRVARRSELAGSRTELIQKLHQRGPLKPADAGVIQDWMTFDYVNRIFNLPKGYLAALLPEADTRYPNLSLRSYAHHHGVDEQAFVMQIQEAVRAYTGKAP